MNKINFDDIYNSGVDIDELTKYYKERKRVEEEDKRIEAEKKKRKAIAKTALKEYLSYNKCRYTSDDLDKVLDSIEEFFKIGEKKDYKDNYWGYTATKGGGDNKWDIKFSDRVTEAERKKLRELFND